MCGWCNNPPLLNNPLSLELHQPGNSTIFGSATASLTVTRRQSWDSETLPDRPEGRLQPINAGSLIGESILKARESKQVTPCTI
jgi:hypothetical protein